MSGQVAAMVKEIRPARAIFEDLMAGAKQAIEGVRL